MSKKLVHRVFEAQANRDPGKIAIEEIAGNITYKELNEQANRVSNLLMQLLPGTASVVATFLSPGSCLITALMGIFKSGNIYLPMDMAFSDERIVQLFKSAAPCALITDEKNVQKVRARLISLKADLPFLIVVNTQHINIEVYKNLDVIYDRYLLHDLPFCDLSFETDPDAGNYIIYTSGSTGMGKAILGCHKGLSHFIHWEMNEFDIHEDCRVSQLSRITFDASFRDIFLPLCTGGTLCIPDVDVRTNILKLVEWIEASNVTMIHCVPSLFRLILKELALTGKSAGRMSSVRHILMAGESLYAREINEWRKLIGTHIELVNLYGTSETTLAKTFHRIQDVPADGSQLIHAGKAISNTAIAIILDGMHCGEGEIGEIYIKTPFCTRGYYKDEEMTKRVFVQNPLVADRVDIVYKTGDMGRYLPDRSIEVLGRLDDQVKINGIRVELAEVSQAISKIKCIEQVVVIAHKNAGNENELVCYYTGDVAGTDSLREQLKKELNDEIIPGYFIKMEEFPLSLNGKIDKRSLPKPEELLIEWGEYEPVQNETEAILERIWQEVLGRQRIGRKAAFFKIGGTSLKAIQVISRIYRELGVSLTVKEFFSSQTIADQGRLIIGSDKKIFNQIIPLPEQPVYPLSHEQTRLWVIDQLETEGESAYNIFTAYTFHEEVNVACLERSFRDVIARHEILRTIFPVENGQPVQKVLLVNEYEYQLEYIDLTNDPDPQSTIKSWCAHDMVKKFNLAKGPLIRSKILQVAANEFYFLLTVHHIIADGWSMEILIREALALYNHYARGIPEVLQPLKIQYRDYAAWQKQLLEAEDMQEHRVYWKTKLQGELPILKLPEDHPRTSIMKNNGSAVGVVLDRDLHALVSKKCEDAGVSLFMFLLATVKLLLHRYSGQEDIIIGSPVAGRHHVDLENQIGFYVNMIALRTNVNPSQGFNSLLEQVKQTTLEAYKYQSYPFDVLIDELSVERNAARNPVFDVEVVLQNIDLAHTKVADEEQHDISIVDAAPEKSKYDLTFNFRELETGIYLRLEYCTDLFSNARISGMASHYRRIVEEVLLNGEKAVGAINYLLPEEMQTLLNVFNNTACNYPHNKTIIELFEEQVQRTPGNIAVVFGEEQISYSKLSERSNRIAAYLVNRGLPKEGIVALCMNRGIHMVVSMLGIFKAGGAYLPVDTNVPEERLKHILEETSYPLVLVQAGFEGKFENIPGAQVVNIDEQQHDIQACSPLKPHIHVDPDGLAYLIFTSGSTGKPKGVMIEHRGMLNHLYAKIHDLNMQADSVVAQIAPYTFDISVWQIWSSLLIGGKVVIYSDSLVLSPVQLFDQVTKDQVTIMELVPSYLAAWLSESQAPAFVTLKYLLLTGEALPRPVVEGWFSKNASVKIVNAYGPTEASDDICHYIIDQDTDIQNIPVGKPVQNTQIYVLNECNGLEPVGVIGEICVAGAGVGRGYWNDITKTQLSFVPNPFDLKKWPRLYRTGDMGRWLEDGNLEFLGRKDQQVKIRGYRIELGEIENVLHRYPLIEAAVVVVHEEGAEKYLIACYRSREEVQTHLLKNYLTGLLPAYMIPQGFVHMAEFPLTPNGKIDRKKLSRISGFPAVQSTYKAPSDKMEAQLVLIYEKVLGRAGVGTEDEFFTIGGHSLKAIQLIFYVSQNLHVQIDLRDVFSHPTIKGLAAFIRKKERTIHQSIPSVETMARYSLSHAQKRLWIIDQLASGEGKAAYNISRNFVFDGDLNINALIRTFERIVDRHEILRTVFIAEAGTPYQKVCNREEIGYRIKYIDLRAETDAEQVAKALYVKEPGRVFDLSRGPLIRTTLLQVAANRYVLLLTLHHIISDGWSMEVLTKEVLQLYNSYVNGAEDDTKPLMVQYKDYASWQNELLQRGAMEDHRSYWLQQLAGEMPVLELPVDYHRPVIKNYNGAVSGVILNKELKTAVYEKSHTSGASVFMILVSLVKVLLYRYTGQEDIIVGSPIAGRDHVDLEDQIGFYVNTLALRTKIKPGQCYDELLSGVKDIMLDAYAHQAYPFDMLVEELELLRNLGRTPVFDVMVLLQNTVLDNNEEAQHPDQPAISGLETVSKISKFDLTFNFREFEEGIVLQLEYSTELFKPERMETMLAHYVKLAGELLRNGALPISEVDFLEAVEKERLLRSFNATDYPYTDDKTIIELFEQQVAATPNAVAVVFGETKLTYRELNERSNRLGHFLRRRYAIQPNDLVGIMADRSEWLVTGILGILKSGAGYVPLEPSFPNDRIQYIIDDANLKCLLIEGTDFENTNTACGLFRFRQQWQDWAECSRENPLPVASSNSIVYVIYTSGSTGNPKGCVLENRGIINRLEWMWRTMDFTVGDVILQKTPVTFDVSVWELFMPLCFGACMVVCSKEVSTSPDKIIDYIFDYRITALHFVPSLFSAFVDRLGATNLNKLDSLKRIIASGEALPPELVKRYYTKISVPLHNMYGPTEASIEVTHYQTAPGDVMIPIGKPISNTRIYILNESLSLMSAGMAGEICISGVGLAKGYLNNEAQTADKFVANPYEKGRRLYRTGDVGRWLPDGNIEFLGRKDQQVKLRGYRIELGEIENVLGSFSGINEVAVIASGSLTDKYIAAYFQSEKKPEISSIKNYLAERLPAYMIPSYLVWLLEFPVNASGKVDRKKLPDPVEVGLNYNREYVMPATEMQRKLAALFELVLGKKAVGTEDDFFALGGHSLKAIQLVFHISQSLQVKIDLKDVFLHPTIKGISTLIEQKGTLIHEPIPLVPVKAHYPLSNAQKRLWIIDQLASDHGKTAYNIFKSFAFQGCLHVDALQKALEELVDRHEILRTVFITVSGDPYQKIRSREEIGYKLDYVDLREKRDPEQKAASLNEVEAVERFDLSRGPLIRTRLLHLDENRYLFLLTLHHIVSDGWSMDVLMHEITTLYHKYVKGEITDLKSLRVQYKDYAFWQNSLLQRGDFEAHGQYWRQQLAGELPVLHLPADYPRPEVKKNNGAVAGILLNKELKLAIYRKGQMAGTSVFMILVSLVKVLLYRYTGQDDIIVGSPIAGRNHIDLENQIGFYVNTLALRTKIKPTQCYDELLTAIKNMMLDAYEHQAYPFDLLVEELEVQRDMSRMPVFDVMVVLQQTLAQSGPEWQGPEQITFSNQNRDATISKFDLTFGFQEFEEGIVLQLEYCTDLFRQERIEKLLTHYVRIAELLMHDGSLSVGQIDFLGEAEKQLLQSFNATRQPYAEEKTIVELFEEQVARTPDAIAVVHEGQQLSYRVLNERSNQLGHYLREQYAIQPDDLVGIIADRGEWFITGILGILKSGAGYVPVDSGYPAARINHILGDACVKLLLTDKANMQNAKLKNAYQGPVFVLDSELQQLASWPTHNLEKINNSRDIAYTIYTSGSTGVPKGCMIEHRSLHNLVQYHLREFGVNQHSRAVLYNSIGFDVSVWELWPYLLSGASVYPLSEEIKLDIKAIIYFFHSNSITHSFIPTKVCEELMRSGGLPDDMWMLTAGEKLTFYNAPTCKVTNSYGPTEATVICTSMHLYKNSHDEILPIGKPIDNARIYILNKQLTTQPIGVCGEIFIAGHGVARGYLNRKELTRERFIEDPYEPGCYMYRTGDLGQWLPDGNIEFIGRADDQVKLRGYRIELGEIEKTLNECAGVESGLVMKMGEQVNEYLVGYYKSKEEISVADIRNWLAQKLPYFMVPAYLVQLNEFPLNSNGKIDRSKLPDPVQAGWGVAGKHISPQTETEKIITGIWERILQRKNIGVTDDFFELGGNSLAIIKVFRELDLLYPGIVKVGDIYNKHFIQSMARFIDEKLSKEHMPDIIERITF
jgi:amino acid adenylation domain-containing protein